MPFYHTYLIIARIIIIKKTSNNQFFQSNFKHKKTIKEEKKLTFSVLRLSENYCLPNPETDKTNNYQDFQKMRKKTFEEKL